MWLEEHTCADLERWLTNLFFQTVPLWSTYLSGRFLAGVLIHSCNFDHGLCGWIREKDSDLPWEPVRDPTGKTS